MRAPMMHQELLAKLLSDSREIVERLLTEPDTELTLLRSQIDDLDDVLQQAGDESFADLILARQLVTGCRALLDRWDGADAGRRRLIQVAVRYVVLEEDGDEDLSSPFGFDDDVEVFNAVAEVLGFSGLVIH
jgi:hypothetical protein